MALGCGVGSEMGQQGELASAGPAGQGWQASLSGVSGQ